MSAAIKIVPGKIDPKEMLSRPSPGATRRNKLDAWLNANPDAMEFVMAWLEMRANGTTEWGLRSVATALREHYGYPFNSESALMNWARLFRPDAYAAANKRGA